jgi:hypothetical protein
MKEYFELKDSIKRAPYYKKSACKSVCGLLDKIVLDGSNFASLPSFSRYCFRNTSGERVYVTNKSVILSTFGTKYRVNISETHGEEYLSLFDMGQKSNNMVPVILSEIEGKIFTIKRIHADYWKGRSIANYDEALLNELSNEELLKNYSNVIIFPGRK